MSRSDRVVVSTVVAVDPAAAFEIFTGDIDTWWKRDPRYRSRPDQGVRFEPGPGGRLVSDEDGETREMGRVLVWEPGAGRLVLELTGAGFDATHTTRVEVRFEAAEGGTRVTLEHSGFDAIPREHPVRHGLEGQALVGMFGVWWGDLLVSMRHYAHSPDSRAPR